MNFQDLKKIEPHSFYMETALNKADKKANEKRSNIKSNNRFQKSKQIELIRIEVIENVINEHLNTILSSFPKIDDLDDFYNELIRITLEYRDLKKSLGAVRWASKTISTLFKTYREKLNRCQDMKFINKLRREYVGRVSSVLKQVKQNFSYLEECRKTMKSFPAVKTNLFTVCIFGFPNAGKSTLLKKLTSANPEINSYAFTTKKLNFGYIKTPTSKIQVIDAPGTLNRKDKMNYIEIQAYLALNHLANLVVFVFDPSLEYSMESQEKLLKKVENTGKETFIYISKEDIADKEIIKNIKLKFKDKIISFDYLEELFIKKAKAFQLQQKI